MPAAVPAALAALAAAVLVTGCDSAGRAGAGTPFGRTAAQTDIDEATAAAGLPASGRPEAVASTTPTARPSATPSTEKEREKERLKARATACSAHWMSGDSELRGSGDPRGKFDATTAELVKRGWRVTTDRREDKVDAKGSTVSVTLKKSGWTLMGRHHDLGSVDMVSFQASEDACMNEFSEKDWELLVNQA
ncbi:hypothetical protein [Streptomyces sp. NPDC058579]|uniref:hypothetical protein n=1 Tax=Streptomyces sp. NPDC058579 TaxID=3346548 RepID=UPI003659FE45